MDLNYGKKWGPETTSQAVPLAASVAFKYKGGKFMYKDGSGNYALCDDTNSTTAIPVGWADVGEFTSPADAATLSVPLFISGDAVFELPVSAAITGTTAKALMFKSLDILLVGGIQQASIAASTYDVIQVVGYDVVAQTVFVKMAVRLGIVALTGVV